ncbi:MAG: tRNA lysidine(34) synthetase TilS [Mucinivorans sp.]
MTKICLEERFAQNVAARGMIAPGESVLMAVSGGVDSMTMLHLMWSLYHQSNNLAVAHCNFGLRAQEGDRETALVERVCAKLGLQCFVARFNTKAEMEITGESTQMAARRLRYDFFEQICTERGFQKVALAHHADDSVETIFINMMRGTGLRGITGINRVGGRIIRPLLFAGRDDVNTWAVDNELEYLNDSSNDWQGYLRNRIRLDILPRMNSSSVDFRRTMSDNIERWEAAQSFIDAQVEQIRGRVCCDGAIDLELLAQEGSTDFLLFELLYPYGFSPEVIADLVASTRTQSPTGKRFFAPRYMALIDRSRVVVGPREAKAFVGETINMDDERVEWLTIDDFDTLHTEANVALLSADSLQFPLELRRWQQGDSFVPIGMHGFKKVSDYLIDAKVSMVDKENQGVLLSGEAIVWLVGRRIDDRYKVTERSKKVVRITF